MFLTFNVGLPEVKYNFDRQSQFFIDLKSSSRVDARRAIGQHDLSAAFERRSIQHFVSRSKAGPWRRRTILPAISSRPVSAISARWEFPLIKGRDFDDRDKHGSTPVIIITETFAKQYFPNEDPIGKRIKPGISTIEDEDSTMREIVGVVGDVRNRTLNTEARAAYYVPHTQVPFSQMVAVVKDNERAAQFDFRR